MSKQVENTHCCFTLTLVGRATLRHILSDTHSYVIVRLDKRVAGGSVLTSEAAKQETFHSQQIPEAL